MGEQNDRSVQGNDRGVGTKLQRYRNQNNKGKCLEIDFRRKNAAGQFSFACSAPSYPYVKYNQGSDVFETIRCLIGRYDDDFNSLIKRNMETY